MTKTYPIAPYEGEWGADIAVSGRPDWLPDGQVVAAFAGKNGWLGLDGYICADGWHWGVAPEIRLPASHGYYADNPGDHTDGWTHSADTNRPATADLDVTEWLRANLPAIEAAGHSVTFAPVNDPFEVACGLIVQDWHSASAIPKSMADIITKHLGGQFIRTRVRPVT